MLSTYASRTIIIIIIIKPHFIAPYEHLKALYKVKTQKSKFKNTLKKII